MCKVLDELSKYIPTKSCTTTHYLPDGEELTLDDVDCKQYPILTGGDQFSVARYRAAQSVRTNDDSTAGRLKGFVPAIEDWHARLTLVKVKMFSTDYESTFYFRLFGNVSILNNLQHKWALYIN